MFPVFQTDEHRNSLLVGLFVSWDDANDFSKWLLDEAMSGYTGFTYEVGDAVEVATSPEVW